ncbi:MAG: PHP domain-containing protein [Bacteroidales bacterium]|nr:PHP domain-containing protein [Bacteroidales bacterium]
MYKNYHKHDHYGNPWTMDVVVKPEEYCKRAIELGHDSVFTINHGVTGNIFEWMELSKKYNLKMHYGTETYFVNDRFDKDRSNRHLIIVAKNNDGAMQLNDIMTEAHSSGFYYKPRIDKELLFSLNPNNFIITTACVAGIWNDPELMLALHRKFGNNFFLELQNHNIDIQKEVNRELLKFSKESHIPIIHANDSHYIYPEDSKYRDTLLKAKGIFYENEDTMLLDYPSEDEIYARYEKQGVLTQQQVKEALENTLVFDECEPFTLINDDIKLPSVSNNPTEDLRDIIRKQWLIERKQIPKERWKEYTDAIQYELDIVEKTHMENYFLIDYQVVKDGQEKYDGRLTNTGRGSAPSFYITKLLGLTDIDRVSSPITLFPTRFMSVERILGTRSLPDIDLNTTDREPFIKATEDLLGKDNCAWMLAWKPLQDASAFRTYCKGIGKDINEYDAVAKNLELYENDSKWKKVIADSKRFVGVIESISESPCFTKNTLIKTSDGYKRICEIQSGDLVLTHNNRYEKVIATNKKISNEIYGLKVMGSELIEVTNNHPFLIRKHVGRMYTKKGDKYTSIRKFTEPYWEQVENLVKGDFIGQPVNNKSVLPSGNLDFDNEDFWWIVGRYIGDGWTRIQPKGLNHGQSYHTFICCNKNNEEDKEIEDKLRHLFHYTKTIEKSTYRFDISSKSLYSFLQEFGKYAYGKHLTDTIINLPVDKLKKFLEGYFSADGYKLKNRTQQSATSISRNLIYGIQQCVHKVYKIPTTIVHCKKENMLNSILADGREIKHKHDIYILSFSTSNHCRTGFYENGYMWLPYRSKTIKSGEYTVFNLQVENDESYTANNIAVHNCSMLLYNKPVRKELGLVRTSKDKLCCLLDGYNCDKYKYLKNDYLVVTVWAIIRDVCKLAGIPIPTIREIDSLFDEETFDIYKNGLTSTINQADSDFATGLVTTYCPQNVSEMSAFVAIIRPGCASLLQDFIDRKPYTTGVPELDELLIEGKHRMIYQELIMKYLIWLGIPETGSYDIIKKIAKKKFKEEELAKLKSQLLEGWKERVGKEKGFIETWTVVEQAAKYSFNASHSLSYAYDSLYGAYLKSHYPLEYYTVALNYYGDDSERTLKLTNELSYFDIKLKPIKFRYSKSNYTLSRKDNSIYKGIQSIKNMNAKVADEIYELRDKQYFSFSDLLFDIKTKTSINSKQLKILIELDFFAEFGDSNKLMAIYRLFDRFYDKSQFKKEVLEEYNVSIDMVRHYALKESAKMFQKVDFVAFMREASIKIDYKPRKLSETIKAQIDYLGYITIVDDRYSGMAVAVSVDTKYSPRLKMYSLKNGTTLDCKIDKKTFNMNPIETGEIITITKTKRKPKVHKNANGEWETIPDTNELWITKYQKSNFL